jgi:sugar lactone lactonase YvrE
MGFVTSAIYTLALLLGVYLAIPLPFTLHEVPPFPPCTASFETRTIKAKTVFPNNFAAEDIFFHKGFLFAGLHGGEVVAVKTDTLAGQNVLTRSSSWQISGKIYKDNVAIFADPGVGGLISMDLTPFGIKEWKVLTTVTSDGRPLVMPNQVDIFEDVVYFSDTMARRQPNVHLHHSVLQSLFSGEVSGRIIAYDIREEIAETLVEGVAFANGVATHPSGEFLVFAETTRAQLRKVYLKGPKKGQVDSFGPVLPAFVDNLHSDGEYLYLAMPILRNVVTETLFRAKWARFLAAKLPELPLGGDPGAFTRISWETEKIDTVYIVENVGGATTVIPHGDQLFLSSYMLGGYLATIELKDLWVQ